MRIKEEVTATATSAKMACNDATTLLLVSGPSDTQHGSLTLINKTNNDNNNKKKKKNRTQEPISIIRNDNEKAEAPASFDCCEMILGELVGTGAFCEVHDVRLLRRRSKTCSKHHQVEEKKGEEETNIEEQQQQQQKHGSREYIYQTCQDTKLGNSRYVVKHLRPNLLSERNHKVFNHASADCLREFEILSRLSHPNIVQLCGYNGGCIIANNNNNNNEEKKEEGNKIIINPEHFFIVLEKLEETLTQRIVRWIHINKRRSITDDDVSEQQQNNGEGDADADADSTISSISIEQQQQQLPPFYIEKLRYARDIANALTYIHSLGMVFRDLKPDNIGITVDGTVKLFDFGLCRELPTKPYNHKNCSAQRNEVDDHSTSSTRSSSNSSSSSSSSNAFIKRRRYDPLYRMSSVGTRRYMSPEVISGYCYNQKTDVYSWSMVFFEILSLQKPYTKYNRSLHKILVCENKGRPHPSMDIPYNSRDLLKRAWAQNSFDRPTMKEIYDELYPMIETVEQQVLPITERSLRAVLEMSELFVFDNNNTTPHLDAGPDMVRNYSSFSQKTTTTRLSLSTTIGSVIASE